MSILTPTLYILTPLSPGFFIPLPITTYQPERWYPDAGEFDNIPICLKLNPLKSTNLEPFQCGTVVSYKESNSELGKYMIECCQLVHENVAYLKVVYRTSS